MPFGYIVSAGPGVFAMLDRWAKEGGLVIEETPDHRHPRERVMKVRKASSDEAPRYVPLHDRDADPSVGEHLPD